MIYLKLLLLTCGSFLTLQCSAQKDTLSNKSTQQKQKTVIKKIILEEMTRGLRRMVTITPSSKMIEINGKISEMKTTASEWDRLMALVTKTELIKLHTYQSPTTKRYSDGALSAELKIVSENGAYNSQNFDSDLPPHQISDLYFEMSKNFKQK